jgi:hypothetical protein
MTDITQEFKKFKVKKSNETLEEFCLPKKFTLQPQQLLLSNLLSSPLAPWNTDDIRGILLYHNIGAGKTCTSIAIAEKFKKKMKIIVVLPAALIGNYITELQSECTDNEYMTVIERNNLKKSFDKKIIEKVNNRISKYYTIYSYNKFIDLIKNKKIKNLNNCLLIIDEVQNMISLHGTFYKLLLEIINKSDNKLKIVLMSATPMFDRPVEIALTLNLLKTKDLFDINTFNQDYMSSITTNKGVFYEMINQNMFSLKIKNLISYYRGAPPQAYPKTSFNVVKCKMHEFQYKSYLTSLSSSDNFVRGSFKNVDILNLPQDFFLGPRMISNVAFPNKSIGELGYSSFKGDYLLMYNIGKYSIKFLKIMQLINKSEGPIFVYSNFKELGGIKCFMTFLEYHGWKNYKTFGEGKKTFSVWTGDETHEMKEEIKQVFNNKNNFNGSQIKIMLGSPSIKEGISLLRVEQVHILEPYWNMSRINQIMGRAIRFCSHKDVPKNKRIVQVYLYLATYPQEKTIDQYVWKLAKKKSILISEFEQVLKQSAIDCYLFYERNSYKSDKIKLKCD